MKLLLAEDDLLQRKVLERVLSRSGYDVQTVSGGEEALMRILEGAFQILITDWDMPGMDGAALCRRAREAKLSGYLYILMLTGHTLVSDLVAGLEAGADDYVRKPFNEAELLARVKAGCRIVELERSLSAANAQIRELSITDQLVGTYNRGYLDEQLPREIERARRYERPLAIILADLDEFKKINDVHGHGVGDEVLKCFTRRVRGSLRPSSDWIARYGGEEFVLVLPETRLSEAASVAERVRSACASEAMATSTGDHWVTASFGVAALPAVCDVELGADSLLRAADTALYRSKHEGRNRVTIASDPP